MNLIARLKEMFWGLAETLKTIEYCKGEDELEIANFKHTEGRNLFWFGVISNCLYAFAYIAFRHSPTIGDLHGFTVIINIIMIYGYILMKKAKMAGSVARANSDIMMRKSVALQNAVQNALDEALAGKDRIPIKKEVALHLYKFLYEKRVLGDGITEREEEIMRASAHAYNRKIDDKTFIERQGGDSSALIFATQ